MLFDQSESSSDFVWTLLSLQKFPCRLGRLVRLPLEKALEVVLIWELDLGMAAEVIAKEPERHYCLLKHTVVVHRVVCYILFGASIKTSPV